MFEYLSTMAAQEKERLLSSVPGLVRLVTEKGMGPFVCAMTELSAERLVALGEGAPTTVAEAMAITESVRLVGERCSDIGIKKALVKATETATDWGFTRYDEVKGALDAIQTLLTASGLPTDAAFWEQTHIFLDGTVLCSPHMPVFWEKIMPLLQANRGKVNPFSVPETVVRLLNGKATHPGEGGTGIEMLKKLQEGEMLVVRGDDEDTTVLSTFISAFARCKPKYRLLLLTMDEKLARAIFFLNLSGLEGEDILVARLRDGGIAELWSLASSMPTVTLEKKHTLPTVEPVKTIIVPVTAPAPVAEAVTDNDDLFQEKLTELLALYGITEPIEEEQASETDIHPAEEAFLGVEVPFPTPVEETISQVVQTPPQKEPAGDVETVNISRLLFTPEQTEGTEQ